MGDDSVSTPMVFGTGGVLLGIGLTLYFTGIGLKVKSFKLFREAVDQYNGNLASQLGL